MFYNIFELHSAPHQQWGYSLQGMEKSDDWVMHLYIPVYCVHMLSKMSFLSPIQHQD